MVDIENRCLKCLGETGWEITDDPLLELVTVMYLINVDDIHPIGRDIVGVKDLKEIIILRITNMNLSVTCYRKP